MKISELYYVEKISNAEAQNLSITKHYLKTYTPATESYGLFKRDDDTLVGFCIFGNPVSPAIAPSLVGKENIEKVTELKRLWVEDECPKNTTSFFLAKTLESCYRPVIVSFADPENEHTGIIYQACNFIYTGLSKVTNDKDRGQKYRYVYFQNKSLESLLRYERLPFPKPENIIYGLYDPVGVGGELRYIGKSTTGLLRPRSHLKTSSLQQKSHKNNWINSLLSRGLTYTIKIIEEISDPSLLNEREIYWIAHFKEKGIPLTNGTLGGEGALGRVMTDESKAKMSEARKKWYENNELPKHLWNTCYRRKEHIFQDGNEYKHCSDCNSFKLLNKFSKNKISWDSLQSVCKECISKRIRELPKQTLSEEQWKQSYISRKAKMSEAIKEKYRNDPTYAARSGKKNAKAIIGTPVDGGNPIEFPSALEAKKKGFQNSNIGQAIRSNQPYRGYLWSFKK